MKSYLMTSDDANFQKVDATRGVSSYLCARVEGPGRPPIGLSHADKGPTR